MYGSAPGLQKNVNFYKDSANTRDAKNKQLFITIDYCSGHYY